MQQRSHLPKHTCALQTQPTMRAPPATLLLMASVDLVEGRVDDAYTRCQRAVELLAGHVADEEAMAKAVLGLVERASETIMPLTAT